MPLGKEVSAAPENPTTLAFSLNLTIPLRIFCVETALGKGKVKLSDLQGIFLQNHGCKWLTATVTFSEKSRSWDKASQEANSSTIAHKKNPKDSLRDKDHLPLFWYGEQIFFKPKVLLNLTESM